MTAFPPPGWTAPWRWHDGDRVVAFGRGVLDDAPELLGEGFVLLTTERAAGAAPALAKRAAGVRHVAAGRVDDVAGDLLAAGVPDGALLVALGGGRVIDVAKALAAATGGRAAAVPTTLSGAEMTRIHRRARGAPEGTGMARPVVVVADPALVASQPEPGLAASAANALAHAVEGPLTPRAHPVAVLVAREAARLLVSAWPDDDGAPPDRDALALGALLAGSIIDSTGYGLHHVLAQTLVRQAGAGHGPANAILLPRTAAALRERAPDRLAVLDEAIGARVEDAAARVRARTGTERLRDLGIDRDALDRCAEAVLSTPGALGGVPPAPDGDEVRAIYADSW